MTSSKTCEPLSSSFTLYQPVVIVTYVPVYQALLIGASGYVFVHRDAIKPTLQRPYDGPYKVLESGPKFYKLDYGGRCESVSVDRLKPAHLDSNIQLEVAQPRPRGRPQTAQPPVPIMPAVLIAPDRPTAPIITRSGRVSRPPRQLTGVAVSEGGLCSDTPEQGSIQSDNSESYMNMIETATNTSAQDSLHLI